MKNFIQLDKERKESPENGFFSCNEGKIAGEMERLYYDSERRSKGKFSGKWKDFFNYTKEGN